MSHALKPLADQVIVITGATTCIGLTTARMASRQGATLVIAANHATTLDRLAGDIRHAGGDVLAMAVDVSSADQVAALGRAALQRFGRIDTWINAGMALDDRDEIKPAPVATRLFNTHYWGAKHGARAALALMRHDGGAIINLDSDGSARHGVKGVTDSLRADVEAGGWALSVTLVHAAALGRHDLHNTPHRVAEAILHAAQHRERDVIAGGAAPLAPPAARFAPHLLEKMTAWFTSRPPAGAATRPFPTLFR